MRMPGVVKAEYLPSKNPDYCGNPFIEALPTRLKKKDFYDVFTLNPSLDNSQRLLSCEERLDLVGSTHFFQPMSIHWDLYCILHSLLSESYKRRNPCELTHWTAMTSQRADLMKTFRLPVPRPRLSAALIGCSGLGKSNVVKRLISLYPRGIIHGIYQRHRLNRIQIPFVYVEARKDCSVRDICMQIVTQVDEIAGTNYRTMQLRKTIDELIAGVAQVLQLYGVGLIILDELQELGPTKSGGYSATVSFVLRLTNTINGCLLIGTPQAQIFMDEEIRYIRRSSGIPEWRPLEVRSKDWSRFSQSMWKCQFTRTETPLDSALSETLHKVSFGIPDFAIEVYKATQRMLILHSRSDDPEIITSEFIAKVAVTHLARELNAMRKATLHKELKGAGERVPSDGPSDPISMPVGIHVVAAQNGQNSDQTESCKDPSLGA